MSRFTDIFGDTVQVRLLEYFLNSPYKEHTSVDVSDATGIDNSYLRKILCTKMRQSNLISGGREEGKWRWHLRISTTANELVTLYRAINR